MNYRIEQDSMGQVKVPSDKYWGAQTQRSYENFVIGSEKMPREIIYAFAILKKSAAKANCLLGKLSEEKYKLISIVCNEILEGQHDRHFPLVVWQTGSGTQTNMNMNEVIANRGNDIAKKALLHPNDDVNMSQSSNDTFPTAMHIAAVLSLRETLVPAVTRLIDTFIQLEGKYVNVIKSGRTHLQDATPISFAQEISGWRSTLERDLSLIFSSTEYLFDLALGATAVGTGLNAPKDFGMEAARAAEEITGLGFASAENKFHALSSKDELVFSHAAIKALACDLLKIANDIRWLASGPRCGLGEINLPQMQPGSSIMPGKVNPVIAEVVGEACYEVIGNDVTIMLCSERGEFELNAFEPGIAYALFNSIFILENAMKTLAEKAIRKLTANPEACLKSVLGSVGIVTAFNPYIGYEKSASIAKEALQTGKAVGDICLERGYLKKEEIDKILEPKNMLNPHMGK